ncbi:hydroxysqualene dehydroxylase HpnE [Saccharopolyspora montiporae]|uniref:hydroxysqualene dehydroxylase HpnE n=1 Tax=Saccharopolyspora montiporae TaxID=2781240 RepID=UPI00351C4CBF
MSRGRIAVIGGGLAGATAAIECADKGFEVDLFEGRPRLGGATYSFQRGELLVDTGQHVFLRCYSSYIGLLQRFGVARFAGLQRRFHVPVLTPGRRPSVLRRGALPAPAHLAPALLGYRLLSLGERARVARTALALRGLDPADPVLDKISFGEWLRRQGETPRGISALWGLLALAALNADPDESSMALAAKVFRTGVLDATRSMDVGVPRVPLARLHGVAAHDALLDAGVRVHLRSKVRALAPRSTGGFDLAVDGTSGNGSLDADSVVVATPHTAAAQLLRPTLPEADRWDRLSASPIVNVHVVYDRQVTGLEMAAAVDSPVQWVFDRTRSAGLGTGQYLALSQSAAHELLQRRTADLRAVFVPALQRLFPRARDARVLDFFVSREPRATFAQVPGSAALRPRARTAVPGLVLAGAWTATGWPDTTEGAVRSGSAAAEAVDQHHRARHGLEVTA